MSRELKLFVHADCFGEHCREQFHAANFDPDHGYICASVTFPDSKDPPDNLLQAARFAEQAKEGQPVWVDVTRADENGRIPIEDSLTMVGNKKVRFRVGFSKPQK